MAEGCKEESLWDLVDQARYMLLDRPKIEADLIYYIAKLDQSSARQVRA